VTRAILSGMSVIRKKPATYDDLVRLPENLVGEILDGELFASPRPAPTHANSASVIGSDLNGPFHRGSGGGGGPGGWWILYEPELHFRRDVLVPDLAGWRRERMPRLPQTVGIELAPDWACEVVSPSTEQIDRSRKMRIYAREQVAHLWIVNPVLRTLEVFGLLDGRWVLEIVHEGNERVRIEPFDAVELDLERWWLPED
jgi:Uma2 family endonuclease